jgi:hypothetical protein
MFPFLEKEHFHLTVQRRSNWNVTRSTARSPRRPWRRAAFAALQAFLRSKTLAQGEFISPEQVKSNRVKAA